MENLTGKEDLQSETLLVYTDCWRGLEMVCEALVSRHVRSYLLSSVEYTFSTLFLRTPKPIQRLYVTLATYRHAVINKVLRSIFVYHFQGLLSPFQIYNVLKLRN